MGTELDLDDVCAGHPLAQRELADLRAQLERAKKVPMKYKRMEFNAHLQKECDALRAQLAAVAAERERYRLGMSDWKATADAKDADLINYAAALSGANCTIDSLKKERDAALAASQPAERRSGEEI